MQKVSHLSGRFTRNRVDDPCNLNSPFKEDPDSDVIILCLTIYHNLICLMLPYNVEVHERLNDVLDMCLISLELDANVN